MPVDYLTVEQRYRLDEACRAFGEAFEAVGSFGVYLVGSVMKRPDFRDVDVRAILPDEGFARLYPNADPRNPARDAYWALSMVALSGYLRESTRLPVDFQVQQQTAANEEFPGPRNALGFGHARARPKRGRLLAALMALRDLPVAGPACQNTGEHEIASCRECLDEAAYKWRCAEVYSEVDEVLGRKAPGC